MDGFSIKLSTVNARGVIVYLLISHLMYADDLVLMAPPSVGLAMLLYVCSKYILIYIRYNDAKSNIVIFCFKRLKNIHIPNFVLHGETLPRVSNCKHIGNIIAEHLSDNDDMSLQYERISTWDNALIRKSYI